MSSERDNWKELYSWQDNYRKKHNLTVTQFLRAINMEATSTYIQYLTLNRIPTSKQGTAGLEIRNALEEAKAKPWTIIVPNISCEDALYDFYLSMKMNY